MLPDLMKFFSRMLSRQGSNSSPTSSISIGRPSERLSSRNCLKYLFVSVVTVNCLSASLFLIHALPWPWGSISKGYRVALVTMIPFWVDSSSLGKPCRAHSETYVQDIVEQHIRTRPSNSTYIALYHSCMYCTLLYVKYGYINIYLYLANGLTVVGSTSISMRLTLVVYGIARLFNSFFQRSSNSRRNSWLNGPRYDKNPDASKTSPTSLHREWGRSLQQTGVSQRCAQLSYR